MALCCLLLAAVQVRADEGMWLLPYLQKLNIKDMKAKGLKLSAEQIYNLNGTSLKDAIVIFGGGCTGDRIAQRIGLYQPPLRLRFYTAAQQRRTRLSAKRFLGDGLQRGVALSGHVGYLYPQHRGCFG